jgi:integrase
MSLFQYKGSKIWTYEFVFHGQRIRESTGTPSKTLAKKIEDKRRRDLEAGAAGIRKSKHALLFSAAAKDYVALNEPTWAEGTLRFEKYNLKHLLPVFGKNLVSDIEDIDVAKYQKQRVKEKASLRTVNMEVGTLRAILRRSGHWARIQPGVRMFKLRESKGQSMTTEVKAATLEACRRSRSRSLYTFVVTVAETGARRGTIKAVRWQSVDFLNRCLRGGKDKTQAGDERVIPLNDRALECLAEWASNFPNRKPEHFVFPAERYGGKGHKFGTAKESVVYGTDPTKPMGDIKTAWNGARLEAARILKGDVKDGEEVQPLTLRIHDLRHTAFTDMRNNRVPLEKIAKILGWSTSQMVRMAAIYGHFTLDDLREGVESIQ